MDLLLQNGDHALDGRGLPVAVQGQRELVQRMLIRLQVRRGAFALDPGLGSELYRLRRSADERNQRLALGYVQEALADLAQVQVREVTCAPEGEEDLLVRVVALVEGEAVGVEVVV